MIRMAPEAQSLEERYTSADFDHSPLVAFYEVTRACDLVCLHCRACAQPRRHPNELNTHGALSLVRQLASFPRRPLLVLTGGDPFKRADLDQLIAEWDEAGMEVALTPSATPLVTFRELRRLRWWGLRRLAVSIDGAGAATHDRIRGVAGSFERSLRILNDARDAGLELQVNTTITADNVTELGDLAELLSQQGLALWSVFFLVPVGRATNVGRIAPEEYEVVFQLLYDYARQGTMRIKTTEAPHYRRYVAQRASSAKNDAARMAPARGRATWGVNDGRGVVFVSHTGVISPSGFLPIPCGDFPRDSVVDIYQQHPLFRSLRMPDLLHGKCGVCRYRHICGGSRARAYAVTGDVLAAEPDCVYQPPDWRPAGGVDPICDTHVV